MVNWRTKLSKTDVYDMGRHIFAQSRNHLWSGQEVLNAKKSKVTMQVELYCAADH